MSESHIGCQDMSPLNVALIVETTENFMEGLDIVEDSSEDNMLTPASDLRCSATSSSIYINHTLPDCQSQGPQEQLTQGREWLELKNYFGVIHLFSLCHVFIILIVSESGNVENSRVLKSPQT